MTDPKEMFFCEYSTKQKCFHIAKVTEALRMNANGIVHHFGLDFIPFAIAFSYDEADAICDELLKLMTKAKASCRVGFEKPSFCIHPEDRSCQGCEHSVLPVAFDPCCDLKKGGR